MAKKTNYSDKLKNPKWQKKRLEILNLHGFKCEKCGCEDKELHVHHRFYIKGREVWQYDNDVFQVLCCDCHEKEHIKEKESVRVVEVVPERYQALIDLLIKCELYCDFDFSEIECLFEFYLNHVTDKLFFSYLISAMNSRYADVLFYNLAFEYEREQESISNCTRLNTIENTIKKLHPDFDFDRFTGADDSNEEIF